MLLRSYSEKDLKEILALFYNAVHLVAAKDYSPAQLDAWAPACPTRSAGEIPFPRITRWLRKRAGKSSASGISTGRDISIGFTPLPIFSGGAWAARWRTLWRNTLLKGARKKYRRMLP